MVLSGDKCERCGGTGNELLFRYRQCEGCFGMGTVKERITAPFTEHEIDMLSKLQFDPDFHPYTCGNRDGHPMDPEGDYGVLVPTKNGWICRHCDYTQSWAHYWPWMEEL